MHEWQLKHLMKYIIYLLNLYTSNSWCKPGFSRIWMLHQQFLVYTKNKRSSPFECNRNRALLRFLISWWFPTPGMAPEYGHGNSRHAYQEAWHRRSEQSPCNSIEYKPTHVLFWVKCLLDPQISRNLQPASLPAIPRDPCFERWLRWVRLMGQGSLGWGHAVAI